MSVSVSLYELLYSRINLVGYKYLLLGFLSISDVKQNET